MLIHGRLILTAHGLMLDEVRSLLQKSLRRRETDLIRQSCKELLAYGKDQLPWKSVLTFMFEDHCLSDEKALSGLYDCYTRGSKYDAIELLSKCRHSRIAACLPVIAMDGKYDPIHWDAALCVDTSLKGLIQKVAGAIDCDLLLRHLVDAWTTKNERRLICSIKLATIVCDQEKRIVTEKGKAYIVALGSTKKNKLHCGLVFLAVLFKNSSGIQMRKYLQQCFKLAAVADSPIRLIMCAPVVKLLFGDKAKQVHDVTTGDIKWGQVALLTDMPAWAVDKHTFRGKFGKGTKHLVKKKPNGMTEEMYETFHGERPQKTIEDFFEDGVYICDPAVEDNPYWNETTAMYFKYTKKQQKTVHMTAIYYKDLKKRFSDIFVKIEGKSSEDEKHIPRKRKRDSETDPLPCTSQNDLTHFPKKMKSSENVQNNVKGRYTRRNSNLSLKKAKVCEEKIDLEESVNHSEDLEGFELGEDEDDVMIGAKKDSEIGTQLKFPLLQLPTGAQKAYSQVDLANKKVWKGPYNERKYSLTMFYHKAMKDVIGDVHVLEVESHQPYIVFPLLMGSNITDRSDIPISVRNFKDCIGKRDVKGGKFVDREALGIIQLHRLDLDKYECLPVTIWAHYLYRYAFNIGDSGLYNSLTDQTLSFVYGIDMEEIRGKAPENNLISILFSGKPAKAVSLKVMHSIRKHKDQLLDIMRREINYAHIERIAHTYNVEFNRSRFINRIVQARALISKV